MELRNSSIKVTLHCDDAETHRGDVAGLLDDCVLGGGEGAHDEAAEQQLSDHPDLRTWTHQPSDTLQIQGNTRSKHMVAAGPYTHTLNITMLWPNQFVKKS